MRRCLDQEPWRASRSCRVWAHGGWIAIQVSLALLLGGQLPDRAGEDAGGPSVVAGVLCT
jgi:hypothetical protein